MPLKNRFQKEREHFNRLSVEAKRFFSAVFLYYLIMPIFSIFTNAFLWRQSNDFLIIALYNFFMYSMLSAGFLLNGLLLKKFKVSETYMVGLISQVLIVASLIFFPDITYLSAIIYGIFSGLAAGLYWANRNLIVLKVVNRRENRMYYSSLEQSSSTLSGIFIPFLAGLVIVFGQKVGLYTPHQGYYLIMVYVLIIAFFIWTRVKDLFVDFKGVSHFFLEKNRGDWDKTRAFVFLSGLLGISNFFPTIMVLKFVGNEESLGTIQSISAIVAAILIYSIAKRAKIHHRKKIVVLSTILVILASLAFSVFYSKFGVILFCVFFAIGCPLSIIPYNSIYFDSIQKEGARRKDYYAHIVDSEIFLDLGRITGIGFFILLNFYSQAFSIRYILFILSLTQISLYWVVKAIDKKQGFSNTLIPEIPKPAIAHTES